MSNKKIHDLLVGLVVILAIGMLVSVKIADNILVHQSKKLVALKAQSQSTADQITQLSNDKKDIATYADLNTIAKSVVPQDKDQAEAVREVVNLAAQSGIARLSSISFPASTLGTAAKKSGGLTQVKPVAGIPGVYDLAITVTQSAPDSVPYTSFVSFLSNLEQNRRTAEVNSISVQPDPTNPNMVTFTLVIDEFIKP